ncbi:MAG: hypothetical protein OIN66_10065 [Candidatus Methanoperedens sp.]|nr:hypothetical protein [Candidatus Methanoperedens sp.]
MELKFLDPIVSVPFYVYLYGFIGALAYVFTSLLDEWEDWAKHRKEIQNEYEAELEKESAKVDKDRVTNLKNLLDQYSGETLNDLLKDFGIDRKLFRILAALPVCAGVYLLFALLIAPSPGTGLPASNTTLMNATLTDLVKLIDTQSKAGAYSTLVAGVSFLTGLYIKTILIAMGSLANRLTGQTSKKAPKKTSRKISENTSENISEKT